MSHEAGSALQKSLDSIDSLRSRMYMAGWITVLLTLSLYARLAYLHQTTDNVERLLSASVAALTAMLAWMAFALAIFITRSTKRILRAIELSSAKKE